MILLNRENITRGESLKFLSGLEFKHLTVNEIINIGFENYMYFVMCFMLKPQDLIVPLWGMGIYYEDITHDELIIKQIKKNEHTFINLFKKMTNAENVYIGYSEHLEQDTIFFDIGNKSYYFGFDTFDAVYNYYKNLHIFKHSPKRFFIGEKTKKSILDEDYEEYVQDLKVKKDANSLSEMISFIVVVNKREWDGVYEYPIGRLYDEYIKTAKRESAKYKLFGIYSGTVDAKKIPSKDLEWFKT